MKRWLFLAIILAGILALIGVFFLSSKKLEPVAEPAISYIQNDTSIKNNSETTDILVEPTPAIESAPVRAYEPVATGAPVVARSFDELTAIYFPESIFETKHGIYGQSIYTSFIQKWGTFKLIYPGNFTPERIEQTFVNIKPIFDANIGTTPAALTGAMSQFLYDNQ